MKVKALVEFEGPEADPTALVNDIFLIANEYLKAAGGVKLIETMIADPLALLLSFPSWEARESFLFNNTAAPIGSL